MQRHFISKIALPLTIIATGLFLFQTAAYAAIFRVKPNGNDANSGASWALAKKTVQGAINVANEGDEIWVAAGTYQENIQNKVFDAGGYDTAVNVALYGGFAGTETERDQRNWNLNLSILDGTNTGSVISLTARATQTTRVDGFVITRGNGFGGGGIYIVFSGPVITNNVIKENLASIGGGIGILNYRFSPAEPPIAHPVITNNKIIDNYATEGGGGIAVIGQERLVSWDPVQPIISGNIIARNISEYNGGGIGSYGHSSPYIANNHINANIAAYDEVKFLGGGGGIYATTRDVDDWPIEFAVSAPTIINNVISANNAFLGAGIYAWDTDIGIPAIINNTVFANNGIGLYWKETSPVIRNNIVAFNAWGFVKPENDPTSAVITHNCVFGNSIQRERTDYGGLPDQTGSNGNISADPMFANYKIGDYHIQPGSPCVNTGFAGAVGAGWTDADGQGRVIGSGVDIGADESDGTVWDVPTPVIYVKPAGNDAQNGLSWATAKQTVAAGISTAALTGGEVWVAAGTYAERIRVPAFVYLYGGFSGSETTRVNRNIQANPTILDGSGIPPVVESRGAGYLVAALDGLTVQNGGNFIGDVWEIPTPRYGGYGGGIRLRVSSPYVMNNTIQRNSMGNPYDNANLPVKGVGLYGYLSHPIISGNNFTQNESLNTFDGNGGAISLFISMASIEDNIITENHARKGSAIYTELSTPRITGNFIDNNWLYNTYPITTYLGSTTGAITLMNGENFLIERNILTRNKAAMGGSIHVTTNLAGRIQNNLIVNNAAFDPTAGDGGIGGGIYAFARTDAVESLFIVNNTIVGNKATAYEGSLNIEQGGGVAVSIPPPITTPPDPIPDRIVIANNIIAFNSSGIYASLTTPMIYPTLVNNDLYNNGGKDYITLTSTFPAGPTDIHADPLFVNRPGGDYHLLATSPCIDAGNNSYVLPDMTTDFEEYPRIMDGDNNGTYIVDIGAYEFLGPVIDTTPPTPNPMTWLTSPYAAGTTSISMVANTATDAGSPPVSYYFHFVNSPTGGTGGSDAGWQSSTSYTNTGLEPNHQYGYEVKARDSAPTPIETAYSSTVYKYTLASGPGASSFSNVTQTCIQANWSANGNRSGTEYYCENVTAGTNSGWTTGISWNTCGLTCGTSYSYRVKARNGDGIETGWTSLGSQMTQACPDTTGPSLSITSHNDGQYVNIPSITLAGTASDSGKGDNGIQQVTVNGARANNDTATGSGTANWSKEVALNQGANTITVIAYDDSPAHNQTSQTITIYYHLFIIYVSKDGICSSHNPCFPNIQNAIAIASAPSLIKISQETYYENIILDLDEEITLQGGWDTNFISNPSYITINGSIMINKGTMTLENIILE